MTALTREERVAACVSKLTSKPEFPAFSHNIKKILTVEDDSGISAHAFTDLIICDYSLTLRVLRAANSLNYSGRPMLSVTRAVIHLGTKAVRHLASSILIFEHFHNKPAGVRELMMLSMLTANHVREIVRLSGGAPLEEAYLCGMARNLGEVLTAYYLPQEYGQILALVDKRKRSLSAACMEVLQYSFEDLGTAIAQYWNMPETIGTCQQPWVSPGRSGRSPDNVLHAAVSLGHLLTTAVYRTGPEERAYRLKSCLREYGAILSLTSKDVEATLEHAILETKEAFLAMRVHIDELGLRTQTRNALQSLREAQPGDEDSPTEAGDGRDAEAAAMEENAGLSRGPSELTLELLAKDACSALDSPANFDLPTFILAVLEAIYRGIGFDRVLFGFTNPDQTYMEGRLGLGVNVEPLIKQFRFRLSMSGGPVSVALLCKRLVIADAQAGKGIELTEIFGCSYLVLYPIVVAGKVVGCLYMESRKPRPSLSARELSQVEQLREALASGIRRHS